MFKPGRFYRNGQGTIFWIDRVSYDPDFPLVGFSIDKYDHCTWTAEGSFYDEWEVSDVDLTGEEVPARQIVALEVLEDDGSESDGTTEGFDPLID